MFFSKKQKYFNIANKHFLVVFYNLYNILHNFIVASYWFLKKISYLCKQKTNKNQQI